MKLLLRAVRILDPASRRDEVVDVLIVAGRVSAIAPPHTLGPQDARVPPDARMPPDARTIDHPGLWLVPGFCDLHVHLREPGEEYKEDILSGCKAAVAGGFTRIVAMPNTRPVIDNAELVGFVAQRGRAAGLCQVLPAAAATRGQLGAQVGPYYDYRRAGAVAVTDDGHPIARADVMRRVLEYAGDFDLPVLTHAEDPALCHGGHMHEGKVSTRLGLRGIPSASEDVAVARDLALAMYCRARLHICHVSTRGAVEQIRRAKSAWPSVTAEAAPHHFTLDHTAVGDYEPNAKMNPPLREAEDRQALIDGLADGTIDAIATDHAPHSVVEKDVPFEEAAHGIIGLQTALPLTLALCRTGALSPLDAIARLTVGPTQVLRLAAPTIAVGSTADLVLVAPDEAWLFTADKVLSKSKNSPFLNQSLRGRIWMTMSEGRVVYDDVPSRV